MIQIIQIQILPMTATQPTRLKAWCKAGHKTTPYQFENFDTECEKIAVDLAKEVGWLDTHLPPAVQLGELPNGNVIALLTQ